MKLSNLPINALVAYPYVNTKIDEYLSQNQSKFRILLDSGAFTAWKAGKEIKLDDYCKFLDNLKFKPYKYFTVDVIGNPKETLNNYNKMLKRGYNPVPIFTRGEDISLLEEYYKTSDIVGIGGLVGTKKNKQFVNGLMKRIKKRKVHWLGFTNIQYIKYYKPFMCDSSAWLTGPRYASTNLYLGNGQFAKLSKKDLFEEKDFMRGIHRKIKDSLAQYGFNYFDLLKSESWKGGNSLISNICASSYLKLSNDLESAISTKLFLAGVDLSGLKQFIINHDRLRSMTA